MDEILKNLYIALNGARKQNGVRPCSVNLNLQAAAKRHCDDMFFKGFCDHIGSDGSDYIARARECGFAGVPRGEILVKGPGGVNAIQAVINAWLGSPGHREILIDSRNMRMGAAYHLKTQTIKGNYWVAVFSY